MKSENICTSDNPPSPPRWDILKSGHFDTKQTQFPCKSIGNAAKVKVGESFVEKIGNWDSMVLNVIIARYLVLHGPISCIDTLVEILCDWRDTGPIQSSC